MEKIEKTIKNFFDDEEIQKIEKKEDKDKQEEKKIIKKMIEYVYSDKNRDIAVAKLYIKSLSTYLLDTEYTQFIYEEISKMN